MFSSPCLVNWVQVFCVMALFMCFSKEIAESWDRKKSVLKNLADMGISADPNKTIRIKTTKVCIKHFW